MLGGALLMARFMAAGNACHRQQTIVAATKPLSALPSADSVLESRGIIDAGTNIFIEKPPSGFGRIPTDPFWLTPKTTDSNAKMDEYGKVPRSVVPRRAWD